ncbi:hypothetical protein F4808DRAFT_244873 [Astrocystis sublimbata]|nr:hypothetical protein F4808DRAFT_244873 [Astrocystis sublimbata]
MDHSQTVQDTLTMDTTFNTTTPKDGGDRDRSPLSNLANKATTTDPTTAIKAIPSSNWSHKDSSEGIPSPHSSIYDAAWISTSDLAKSPYQTPAAGLGAGISDQIAGGFGGGERPQTPVLFEPVTKHDPEFDFDFDLNFASPLSRLETPFLYGGYGTELAPILEQRSIATLRTKASASESDLSSLLHDAPSNKRSQSKSDSTFYTATTGGVSHHPSSRNLVRRQNSFNLHAQDCEPEVKKTTIRAGVEALLGGLPGIKSHRNGGGGGGGRDRDRGREWEWESGCNPTPQLKRLTYTRPKVHVMDVHAYPRKPIFPPPEQAKTPPSLRRIVRPKSDGHAYASSVPYYTTVTASSNDDTGTSTGTSRRRGGEAVAYAAPSFRIPRSGHGNLASHPWNRRHSTTAIPAASASASTSTNTNAATATATGISTSRSASTSLSTGAIGRHQGRRTWNDLHLHFPLPPTSKRHSWAGGGGGVGDGVGRQPLHQQQQQTEYPPYRTHLPDAQDAQDAQDPDLQDLLPPEVRGTTCKRCRHPRGESWSLGSTITGRGPGIRRGSDWCSRCACRKIMRVWCCGNVGVNF